VFQFHAKTGNSDRIRRESTATHGSTPQPTAAQRNPPQHDASECNTLQQQAMAEYAVNARKHNNPNTVQRTATYYNTLQQAIAEYAEKLLQHTATYGNTPQHTATYRNALQLTVTHCNRQ